MYGHKGQSRGAVRVGMWLYEMMSGFSSHQFHKFISREETLMMAPGLQVEGLTGGCVYYDAIVSDNRWTLETVKDGVRSGGVAVNHAPVGGLLKEEGEVVGVTCHDQIGDATYEVRSTAVINATGVFSDQIRRLDRPDTPNLIRLSKGTHLIFGEEDTGT